MMKPRIYQNKKYYFTNGKEDKFTTFINNHSLLGLFIYGLFVILINCIVNTYL